MDHEMIARVSKAILETPNASDYKTLVAINAIKAMREPTSNMLIKADYLMFRDKCKDIWQRMIDAVLND